MLHALTELNGLTASDLFRTQLREAFARYARTHNLSVAQALAVVRQRSFQTTAPGPRMDAMDVGAPSRDELRILSLLANKSAPMLNTDIMQYTNPDLNGVAVSRITAALAKRFLVEGDAPHGWTITNEGRAELDAWRRRR